MSRLLERRTVPSIAHYLYRSFRLFMHLIRRAKLGAFLSLTLVLASLVLVLSHMNGREFFNKKPGVQKQAIPAYSFRGLLSPEFEKIENFKLQGYVLSTSKSVPPYYFVVFEQPLDNTVSPYMLETGGFFDEFVHYIFDWHYAQSKSDNYVNDTPIDCSVLDVGMNFGSFALYAASKNCEVYGFEIQSSIVFGVALAVRLNNFEQRLHMIRKAASNVSGVPVKLGVISDTNIGSTPVVYDNTNATDETVLTVRVDDVVEYPRHITFAKVDVEGSEYRALQGMKPFLQSHLVDGLVIELRDDDQSKQWISDIYDWGYVCMDVSECQFPLNNSAALQTFPFMTSTEKALERSNRFNNFWCVPEFRTIIPR